MANLCLPSGEQVAKALGEESLSADVLWSAGSAVLKPDELDGSARKDLDEAIEWAKKIPTGCGGAEGCIEIRPLLEQPAHLMVQAAHH